MNNSKSSYKTPETMIFTIQSEGFVCQTNLEPIEPGDEHEW